MNWTNFHTHCCFCDGTAEPGEYVKEAVRQGMKAIGFSSHAPLPFSPMYDYDVQEYFKTIQLLKQSYADKIPVYLGMEIDFVQGVITPSAPEFKSSELDYKIGSVHFLGISPSGKHWTVDSSEENFVRGINEDFEGDIKKAVGTYYYLIREMVKGGNIDIIGHFDIIKKNNAGSKFFSEDETWYRKAVFDTLDVISASGVIVEVNTGGITRKYTDSVYPSLWILEHCYEMGIPITLNSDAHKPEHITDCFEETAGILKCIGFKKFHALCAEGWKTY